MTRIRRITVSQVEGSDTNNTDPNEIRPFGETAFYLDQNQNPNKLTLMMFDGTRTHLKSKVLSPGMLFGSNADSGDGASLDTIKLIPDAALYYSDGNYGNDQYLIVDPTGPNHIHIRAGGIQDNSNADLYLGGELTHVIVSDTDDNVVIRTSIAGEGAIPQSWTFDNTGKLTFPSGLTADPIGNYVPVPGTVIQQTENEILQVISKGLSGSMTLGWAENPFAPSQVASLSFNDNSEGKIRIATGSYTGTVYTWAFDATGLLNLPRGGAIRETEVTNELWGTTTTSLTLVPSGAANGTQRLEIYSTGGSEGNHIHITSGDQNQTDLFLGNDTQYFAVGSEGANVIQARPGAASSGSGVPAGAGSPVLIYAGDAGFNGGDPADGAMGGEVWLQAGTASSGVGGQIILQSASGPDGFGSIKLSTDGGGTYLEFNDANQLVFPNNSEIIADTVTANNFVGDGSSLTNVTINVAGNIVGTSSNVTLVAGNYSYTFDNTGVLTLPTVGGDEGGEINFSVPATNTTLTNPVKIDVFQDRLRFFEGSTKGAYIDLNQAAVGVGTLLNNRVSGIVNSGTFVTMDNIKATVTTSAPRGLSLATVTGSFAYNIGGNFSGFGVGSGGTSLGGQTLTTTPTASIFGWGFTNAGDLATYVITNTSSLLTYRITVQIGNSFNNNSIIIERLI